MANTDYPQVNIDLSEEWKAASEMSNERKNNGFSEKNYLNVRLEKGEKEKKLCIRLLPMDPKGGSPFVHVHFHTVEVNEALVKPGQKPYKSYASATWTVELTAKPRPLTIRKKKNDPVAFA